MCYSSLGFLSSLFNQLAMKILLVEDDLPLAEALTEALVDQGYDVDVVNDGEKGWQQITHFDYDLILLDVMLPQLDGISLCQRLRSSGYPCSILMLTALDTSMHKVKSLDAGADDYVVKPVDLPELFARIRALSRRGGCSIPPVLEWAGLQLDPSSHEVTYNHQPVHLTPKEYSCLELFLRNSQRIINREFIIEHLWSSETSPFEDTVKAHIKSLRHKLRGVGAPDDLIQTVHGIGYRLKHFS